MGGKTVGMTGEADADEGEKDAAGKRREAGYGGARDVSRGVGA